MKKVILLFAIAFAAVPCFAQLPFAKCEACKKAGAKFFQGDPQGAIALLDEAIAKDPSSSDAYRMRGDFRGHLGDFKRSVEDYKAALALDPSAVDVYEKLARWQMFLRDYYGALATLDAALAHGVKSESVYVQRGDLHLDRQDIGAATVDYTNAI
ncbi:MAG: tetratricopeptide repeat protein, partial [Pyrinomonadaceae bacterium]